MIAKKNSRYNLEGKRIVIFSLGLLTTTAATLAAFTYKSPLEFEREKQKIAAIPVEYMVEEREPEIIKPDVIREQQQQNNQQQNQNDDQSQQSSSIDLNQNITTTQNKPTNPITQVGAPNVGSNGIGVGKVTPPLVPFPDKEAEYVGGYGEMQKNISQNFKYPEIDLQTGVQGVVYVNFVVELDGSISNINIERGLSSTLDREAKRIVKQFPNWIPGEVQGEPVRTRVMLPIRVTAQ